MRPSYPSLDTLFKQYQERAEACSRYVDAYRRYCWPVQHLNDLKFAPFHLLASEHQVFFEKDPLWHLQQLAPLAEISPLLQATAFQSVDLENPESVAQGVQWWEHLTEKRRRRNGCETHKLLEPQSTLTTGDEMPWTRIFKNHLWP
jgi:hypothetical protein